ncbi:MAG TPA: DUF4339 domain-containing protein [Rhodothermales bacterium]|nr:DUF4339 domain-containing protein [Rhodothermales bacterium]
MRTWYCHRGGLSYGPFDDNTLILLARGGQLAPSDWVTLDGGAHWVAAAQVPGLFPAPTPAPGALQPAGQVPAYGAYLATPGAAPGGYAGPGGYAASQGGYSAPPSYGAAEPADYVEVTPAARRRKTLLAWVVVVGLLLLGAATWYVLSARSSNTAPRTSESMVRSPENVPAPGLPTPTATGA